MAMPSFKISKTMFREQYNLVGILTDKSEIMKQLQTFNSKNQAVAFGVKKKHKVTLDDVIDEMRSGFKQINDRIDNLVRQNNLEEKQQ